MAFRIRHILVAIRATGARIELFHAINEPEALDALRRGSAAGQAD